MTKTVILLLCYLTTLSVAQGFDIDPEPTSPWNDMVSQNGMPSACERENSRYPMPGQCDAYVECEDWQPINMLCPDGLHFNPEASLGEYPCGFLQDVPCDSAHSGLRVAQGFDIDTEPTPPLPPPAPTAPPAWNDMVSQNGIPSACERENSRYPMPGQCDAYVECEDWQPINMLCPDGLHFNPEASLGEYPCGFLQDVPCDSAHSGLQLPQPTAECPRRNGYFSAPGEDSLNCESYLVCVDGKAFIFECDMGLAWNPASYKCDSPDQVPGCDFKEIISAA